MKTLNSNMFIRLVFQLSIATIVFGCSGAYEQGDSENNAEKTTASDVEFEAETNNPYMVFKLYKVKSKGLFAEPRGLEIESEFDKIYSENDVKVIGSWHNANDPTEVYFITAYLEYKLWFEIILCLGKEVAGN